MCVFVCKFIFFGFALYSRSKLCWMYLENTSRVVCIDVGIVSLHVGIRTPMCAPMLKKVVL